MGPSSSAIACARSTSRSSALACGLSNIASNGAEYCCATRSRRVRTSALSRVVRALGRTFRYEAGFYVDEKAAAKDDTLSIEAESLNAEVHRFLADVQAA